MASTLTRELLAKYAGEYEIFVETGTAKGEGIQVALDHGFSRLFSIEANDEAFALASERFADHPEVAIIHGDGGRVLEEQIAYLDRFDKPICFWLDSHWSNGEPPLPAGAQPCPLLAELRAIAQSKVQGHLIMIDDCRYFWGLGIPQWQNVSMLDIVAHIQAIDPNYWLSFEPSVAPIDILIAKAPRIVT